MGSVGSLSPAAGDGSLATPNDTGRSIRRREVTPSGLDVGSRFTVPRETKTPPVSPGPGRWRAVTAPPAGALGGPAPHSPAALTLRLSLPGNGGKPAAFSLFSAGLFHEPPKRSRASLPASTVTPGLFPSCLLFLL